MNWTPKVGDTILVTKAHASLPVGMTIKVTAPPPPPPGNGTGCGCVVDGAGSQYTAGHAVNFNIGYVGPTTRAKRAEILEEQAEKLFKDANEAAEKARSMKAEARRLREFETDEDELADLLVSVQDGKGSRAQRVAKLAEMLKGRIKTSYL